MRVTNKVRAMMEDGEVSPFDELSDAPGTSWRRRARAFKKSGEGVQEVGLDRVLGGCARDCDRAEPWCPVTNCPESEGRE